jgi:hypothetical protein
LIWKKFQLEVIDMDGEVKIDKIMVNEAAHVKTAMLITGQLLVTFGRN